jgi:serine/threonine-protein kinase
MIGTTLSHYRVVGQLGQGGMGIVYKAEDTKLDRTVALKLLPPHALASEDDRARFYREARAAAALNHPNIAHVYEIDESDVEGEGKRPFIAMEYIDGESLAERIAKGPLPLQDAISIATQVADGLKAAHEKDIVHRDVKSGNIMLTLAGVPKILDFGLAKTAASTKLTQMGSTLGTVAYMSPEQARGEEVDRRSDVWSLGVILYEMVSGRMPFLGDYEQATIYGILNAEPEPLTAVRTGVPMELERIVSKCLVKDPGRRYQSTTDLIVDLENLDIKQTRTSTGSVQVSGIAATPASTAAPVAERQSSTRSRFGAAAAAVGVVGLFIGAFGMWLLRPASPVMSSSVVTDLVLPDGVVLEASLTAPLQLDRVALSIDDSGKNVVFAGGSNGTTDLYLRSLESGETTKLEGTQGAYGPFFSPDGQWIGFFVGTRLKKVSADGATVVDLAEAALPYGGSWGDDGRIVYSTNEGEALAVVDQNGANRRIVSVDVIGEMGQVAHVGSGGQVLVAKRGLVAVDVDSEESRDLGLETANIALLDDETLLVLREGQLFAIHFDAERLELVGDPVQIQSGVLHERFAQYAVSNSGTLVYAPGPWLGEDRLAWLYEDGRIETIRQFDAQIYGEFNLSPSADRVAISVLERPLRTLWVYDFQRGSRIRLTSEGNTAFSTWTPDGRAVVFRTRIESGDFMMTRSAEGIGAVDTLATGLVTPAWVTPDGNRVGTVVSGPNGIPDIVIQDFARNAPTEPVTAEPTATEVLTDISADGRFVAYTSDQTGDYQVYVEPFPPTGERWQVSVAGGEEPRWTKDGARLFYRIGDYLMGVDVEFAGGTPRFSVPDTLFAGKFTNVPGYSYDYDDLNKRWLILRRSDTRPEVRHLKVVSNLKARVDAAMNPQSK